jgi:hypothetical protein
MSFVLSKVYALHSGRVLKYITPLLGADAVRRSGVPAEAFKAGDRNENVA